MAKVLRMMAVAVLVGSAAAGCAAKEGGSGMASAGATTQGGGEVWTGTAESAAKFGP